MNSSKFGVLLILTFFAIGCASTSNIEINKSDGLDKNLSITEVEAVNTTGETFEGIDVEVEMRLAVMEAVRLAELNDRSGTAHKLKVDIVQYEKGNAAARWLMPGLGKTILSVEATLLDEADKPVASSQATKSVGAGGAFTIGAWKAVFEGVAKSLVKDIKDSI
tara:strand:+ start:521 stop:1012 length:492 start_codon:yes stop_codon:yes gene_type:complete